MVATRLPAILHQKPGAVYLVADEKIESGILSLDFTGMPGGSGSARIVPKPFYDPGKNQP
ncbi:MAG: hypothetical protein OER87_20965 [Gammaproteobacteria bacterium]|nr:hypothetical protein [Gammaproteobacteria bacterium]